MQSVSIATEFSFILNIDSFCLVFSISFCLFLLTTKHLIRVYKWFASVAIVVWSYFLNDSYVRFIESKKDDFKFQEFSLTDGIFYTFITNYLCQVDLFKFCAIKFSTVLSSNRLSCH